MNSWGSHNTTTWWITLMILSTHRSLSRANSCWVTLVWINLEAMKRYDCLCITAADDLPPDQCCHMNMQWGKGWLQWWTNRESHTDSSSPSPPPRAPRSILAAFSSRFWFSGDAKSLCFLVLKAVNNHVSSCVGRYIVSGTDNNVWQAHEQSGTFCTHFFTRYVFLLLFF